MSFSLNEARGDWVRALDGNVGKVHDFLIGGPAMRLRHVLIDTRQHPSRGCLRVAQRHWQSIDPVARELRLGLTGAQLAARPARRGNRGFDGSRTGRADGRGPAERLHPWRALRGQPARGIDGTAGWLDDLLVDEDGWFVRGLVLRTGRWPGGKRVVVPSARLVEPGWARGEVRLDVGCRLIAPSRAAAV